MCGLQFSYTVVVMSDLHVICVLTVLSIIIDNMYFLDPCRANDGESEYSPACYVTHVQAKLNSIESYYYTTVI